MKFLFVLIACLTFASFAQAEKSKFEILGENFVDGYIPQAKYAEGWRTGRCYSKSEPNITMGAMLIVATVFHLPADTTNNGPLFPQPAPTKTLNMGIARHINAAPDRYDTLTDADKRELLLTAGSPTFKKLITYADDGSWYSDNLESNTKYALRIKDSFLFAQRTVLKDVGTEKAGDVINNCYFFKKIN